MPTNHTAKALLLSWEYAPLIAGGLGPLIRAADRELRNQDIETTLLLPHNLKDSGITDSNVVSVHSEIVKLMKTECNLPDYEFNSYDKFNTSKKHTSNTWPQLYSQKRKKTPAKRSLYPNNTPKMTRAYALAVAEYLRQHVDEYDVVIGADWLTIASFHMIKREFDLPFIFYINATEYDRAITLKGYASQYCNKMEVSTYPQADGVIAISDISKKILIEHHQVPPKKLITVYDDHEFEPIDEPIHNLLNKYNKNVLFLGRLQGQKGLKFLMDTAARVIEIDPQITFLVAGEGAMIESIIQSISEKGMEKNVFLTGWIGGEDKRKLYRTANLFVMPSPSEPFGLTALEAIKSDVPVISSKTCGFLSVIPSTPTFDYHDTYDFAQKIVYYLQHQDAAQDLIKAQQEELNNHSWSREVKKIKDLTLRLKSA